MLFGVGSKSEHLNYLQEAGQKEKMPFSGFHPSLTLKDLQQLRWCYSNMCGMSMIYFKEYN